MSNITFSYILSCIIPVVMVIGVIIITTILIIVCVLMLQNGFKGVKIKKVGKEKKDYGDTN